jgi:hypothetical protein
MRIVELSQVDPASILTTDIPAALAALAALQGALAARLLTTPAPVPSTEDDDVMLTTPEAAKLLRRSPKWIYRHARHLGFVKRLGPRSMVHSKRGVEKYLASRKT